MDNYDPTPMMIPILNIIKGNLVQHSNELLSSTIITQLSLNITEALEFFLKNDEKIKKELM